ncbi:acetate/propionate family kinase [Rhizobium sp. No.120]
MKPLPTLITFNAGSSSVKIGLFEVHHAKAIGVGRAAIDFRRRPLTFHLSGGPTRLDLTLEAAPGDELHAVIEEIFDLLGKHMDLSMLGGVGHRIVHGGDLFISPVQVSESHLASIELLAALAPLHQMQAVRLIKAVKRLRADLPQSASFDTAFHATQDDIVRRFALPRALHNQGVKRYGFHGLSYRFVASALQQQAPRLAAGKVVVAHLGSGASLCALDGGKSRDCSMGFSTLDGIPMATRCGALDPGALLHLLGPKGRTLRNVEDMLYHHSGLLGVSGISADTRDLLSNDSLEAKQALELFALRIAGEVCRMAATLGGLDGLVFTAGIGEHQPQIRAMVARHLAWLGLELDTAANSRNEACISTAQSRLAALVIPTDEEQIIADEAVSLLLQKLPREHAGGKLKASNIL